MAWEVLKAGDGLSTSPAPFWTAANFPYRLFILEGLLTVILGALVPLYLPDSPAKCKFLTMAEKEIVARRLQIDDNSTRGASDAEERFQSKHVVSAFKDWKVWMMVVVYWGSAIPVYGYVSA